MATTDRIQALKDMLLAEPGDLFLNYALAMEYLSHTHLQQEAKDQFLAVLKIQPTYIPAFYQLGKWHESSGQIADALNYYREGMEQARLQKNNKALNEFGEAIFMLED